MHSNKENLLRSNTGSQLISMMIIVALLFVLGASSPLPIDVCRDHISSGSDSVQSHWFVASDADIRFVGCSVSKTDITVSIQDVVATATQPILILLEDFDMSGGNFYLSVAPGSDLKNIRLVVKNSELTSLGTALVFAGSDDMFTGHPTNNVHMEIINSRITTVSGSAVSMMYSQHVMNSGISLEKSTIAVKGGGTLAASIVALAVEHIYLRATAKSAILLDANHTDSTMAQNQATHGVLGLVADFHTADSETNVGMLVQTVLIEVENSNLVIETGEHMEGAIAVAGVAASSLSRQHEGSIGCMIVVQDSTFRAVKTESVSGLLEVIAIHGEHAKGVAALGVAAYVVNGPTVVSVSRSSFLASLSPSRINVTAHSAISVLGVVVESAAPTFGYGSLANVSVGPFVQMGLEAKSGGINVQQLGTTSAILGVAAHSSDFTPIVRMLTDVKMAATGEAPQLHIGLAYHGSTAAIVGIAVHSSRVPPIIDVEGPLTLELAGSDIVASIDQAQLGQATTVGLLSIIGRTTGTDPVPVGFAATWTLKRVDIRIGGTSSQYVVRGWELAALAAVVAPDAIGVLPTSCTIQLAQNCDNQETIHAEVAGTAYSMSVTPAPSQSSSWPPDAVHIFYDASYCQSVSELSWIAHGLERVFFVTATPSSSSSVVPTSTQTLSLGSPTITSTKGITRSASSTYKCLEVDFFWDSFTSILASGGDVISIPIPETPNVCDGQITDITIKPFNLSGSFLDSWWFVKNEPASRMSWSIQDVDGVEAILLNPGPIFAAKEQVAAELSFTCAVTNERYCPGSFVVVEFKDSSTTNCGSDYGSTQMVFDVVGGDTISTFDLRGAFTGCESAALHLQFLSPSGSSFEHSLENDSLGRFHIQNVSTPHLVSFNASGLPHNGYLYSTTVALWCGTVVSCAGMDIVARIEPPPTPVPTLVPETPQPTDNSEVPASLAPMSQPPSAKTATGSIPHITTPTMTLAYQETPAPPSPTPEPTAPQCTSVEASWRTVSSFLGHAGYTQGAIYVNCPGGKASEASIFPLDISKTSLHDWRFVQNKNIDRVQWSINNVGTSVTFAPSSPFAERERFAAGVNYTCDGIRYCPGHYVLVEMMVSSSIVCFWHEAFWTAPAGEAVELNLRKIVDHCDGTLRVEFLSENGNSFTQSADGLFTVPRVNVDADTVVFNSSGLVVGEIHATKVAVLCGGVYACASFALEVRVLAPTTPIPITSPPPTEAPSTPVYCNASARPSSSAINTIVQSLYPEDDVVTFEIPHVLVEAADSHCKGGADEATFTVERYWDAPPNYIPEGEGQWSVDTEEHEIHFTPSSYPFAPNKTHMANISAVCSDGVVVCPDVFLIVASVVSDDPTPPPFCAQPQLTVYYESHVPTARIVNVSQYTQHCPDRFWILSHFNDDGIALTRDDHSIALQPNATIGEYFMEYSIFCGDKLFCWHQQVEVIVVPATQPPPTPIPSLACTTQRNLFMSVGNDGVFSASGPAELSPTCGDRMWIVSCSDNNGSSWQNGTWTVYDEEPARVEYIPPAAFAEGRVVKNTCQVYCLDNSGYSCESVTLAAVLLEPISDGGQYTCQHPHHAEWHQVGHEQDLLAFNLNLGISCPGNAKTTIQLNNPLPTTSWYLNSGDGNTVQFPLQRLYEKIQVGEFNGSAATVTATVMCDAEVVCTRTLAASLLSPPPEPQCSVNALSPVDVYHHQAIHQIVTIANCSAAQSVSLASGTDAARWSTSGGSVLFTSPPTLPYNQWASYNTTLSSYCSTLPICNAAHLSVNVLGSLVPLAFKMKIDGDRWEPLLSLVVDAKDKVNASLVLSLQHAIAYDHNDEMRTRRRSHQQAQAGEALTAEHVHVTSISAKADHVEILLALFAFPAPAQRLNQTQDDAAALVLAANISSIVALYKEYFPTSPAPRVEAISYSSFATGGVISIGGATSPPATSSSPNTLPSTPPTAPTSGGEEPSTSPHPTTSVPSSPAPTNDRATNAPSTNSDKDSSQTVHDDSAACGTSCVAGIAAICGGVLFVAVVVAACVVRARNHRKQRKRRTAANEEGATTHEAFDPPFAIIADDSSEDDGSPADAEKGINHAGEYELSTFSPREASDAEHTTDDGTIDDLQGGDAMLRLVDKAASRGGDDSDAHVVGGHEAQNDGNEDSGRSPSAQDQGPFVRRTNSLVTIGSNDRGDSHVMSPIGSQAPATMDCLVFDVESPRHTPALASPFSPTSNHGEADATASPVQLDDDPSLFPHSPNGEGSQPRRRGQPQSEPEPDVQEEESQEERRQQQLSEDFEVIEHTTTALDGTDSVTSGTRDPVDDEDMPDNHDAAMLDDVTVSAHDESPPGSALLLDDTPHSSSRSSSAASSVDAPADLGMIVLE